METLNVYTPDMTILYDNKDITHDLKPHIISLTYTDVIREASNSIDVVIENTEGLWLDQWYPDLSSLLTINFGYKGEKLISRGRFQIDQITFSCNPDTVKMRALATGVTISQRTYKARSFENTTLKSIAQEIASANELDLIGEIEEIPFRRVTQIHETDLTFLNRIAQEFGYNFTIKEKNLHFLGNKTLKELTPTLTIDLKNHQILKSWSFTDKIKDIVKSAKATYHDPLNRETIGGESFCAKDIITSEDELKLNVRCEDENQAKKIAQAAIETQNEDKETGTLNLIGDPNIYAGQKLNLINAGKLSGIWLIHQCTHSITRSSGFTTDLTIKKVYEYE